MIPLGTTTQWGKVVAVLFVDGERLYNMVDSEGTVSLMPAVVVEEKVDE